MEPQMQQDKYPDITPEDAKASLGLSTRMSEQMLMMQAQQDGTMPQEGSGEPQEPQGQEQGGGSGETSDLRKQYEDKPNNDDKLDEVLEEIKSIKEEIKQVLEDDKKEEDNKDENGQKE